MKRYKRIAILVFDLLMVLVLHFCATSIIPAITGSSPRNAIVYEVTVCTVIVHMAFYIIFGVYSIIWKYARPKNLLGCIYANIAAEALLYIIVLASGNIKSYPFVFFVYQFLLVTLVMMVSRIVYMYHVGAFSKTRQESCVGGKRLMVVGAGSMAALFLDDLYGKNDKRYNPVCIIDDDVSKVGRKLRDVKVMGTSEDIARLAKELKIDTILFCINTIDEGNRQRILNVCFETGCHVSKMIIGFNEEVAYSIKKINISDLLGRKEVLLDDSRLSEFIGGRTVMVTGGGGSIGSELARYIATLAPKKLIIVDNYENNAYEIQQELIRKYGKKLNFETEIASVCDRDKMKKLFEMYRPEILYHAAAHKHVPFMEHNPEEAIKNNVFGTLNVSRLASEYGVKRFVLVSTDKAVNPTNIMGASKRVCEMIVQTMNNMSQTEFVAVRFGNVLGSHGSVIPLFKEQIEEGGPVTVTHPDIIRYFMTIPEAVRLLLAAGDMAKGGEIFVLDMGDPVKIDDLARKMIRIAGLVPDRDIEIKYSGLRPGEKLYEELLLKDEGIKSTENKKIFIGSSTYINSELFYSQLEELKKAALANNSEEIRNLISQIVPTYHCTQN